MLSLLHFLIYGGKFEDSCSVCISVQPAFAGEADLALFLRKIVCFFTVALSVFSH